MRIAEVQFNQWDKYYDFSVGDLELKISDYVVVETQLGLEIGKVINIKETPESEIVMEIKPILRKASADDLAKKLKLDKSKEKAIKECKKYIEKYELPMKLVDVYFSFDDTRITFAFIANGRIDFRELVKDLTRHFKKQIRLQQIGIRDEVKVTGDFGPCGRSLCCQQFVKELGNITSEMADIQQVAHRGSERLSGCCGRLRCCLAFEQNVYEEASKKLPVIGSVIKTDRGRGEVIGWHTLKQAVDVRLLDEADDKGVCPVIEVGV